MFQLQNEEGLKERKERRAVRQLIYDLILSHLEKTDSHGLKVCVETLRKYENIEQIEDEISELIQSLAKAQGVCF